MQKTLATFIICLLLQCSLFAQMTPDQVLERLMQGNERYVKGEVKNPDRDDARRKETVARQNPFAVILGCSDSRVSPEIIFDAGIGELFVVRVAGNVVGPIELDSIEFSALNFESSVILVLGHKNCGAVRAVMEGNTRDIEAIAMMIEPAVEKAQAKDPNNLETAVKMNVQGEVEKLKHTTVIQNLIKQGKVKVIGGYYDLASGQVELLSQENSAK